MNISEAHGLCHLGLADAGWLDGMVEQFEEARQHNVLHSVLRSDDRWDSLQASARYPCSFPTAYGCDFDCVKQRLLDAVCIYLLIVAILALDESMNGLHAKDKHTGSLVVACHIQYHTRTSIACDTVCDGVYFAARFARHIAPCLCTSCCLLLHRKDSPFLKVCNAFLVYAAVILEAETLY